MTNESELIISNKQPFFLHLIGGHSYTSPSPVVRKDEAYARGQEGKVDDVITVIVVLRWSTEATSGCLLPNCS